MDIVLLAYIHTTHLLRNACGVVTRYEIELEGLHRIRSYQFSKIANYKGSIKLEQSPVVLLLRERPKYLGIFAI